MSAPDLTAFGTQSGRCPGTKSPERWSRARFPPPLTSGPLQRSRERPAPTCGSSTAAFSHDGKPPLSVPANDRRPSEPAISLRCPCVSLPPRSRDSNPAPKSSSPSAHGARGPILDCEWCLSHRTARDDDAPKTPNGRSVHRFRPEVPQSRVRSGECSETAIVPGANSDASREDLSGSRRPPLPRIPLRHLHQAVSEDTKANAVSSMEGGTNKRGLVTMSANSRIHPFIYSTLKSPMSKRIFYTTPVTRRAECSVPRARRSECLRQPLTRGLQLERGGSAVALPGFLRFRDGMGLAACPVFVPALPLAGCGSEGGEVAMGSVSQLDHSSTATPRC